MDRGKDVYIGLGSNLGNKFQNLQLAVNAIHEKIGSVRLLSQIYKTPAVGFDGDCFLNACILVSTYHSPKKVLNSLLSIEKNLGRIRSKNKNYESRSIDLDILLYDSQIIEKRQLTIPHPEMHKRLFVLKPLADIAKDKIHPILNTKIEKLLVKCSDSSQIQIINKCLSNPIVSFDFSLFNYIAIEGNIGAGKTSLATQMAKDFNGKLILERFADNPFLPKFYKDPQRYAFTLEMSFLADRYQQISDDLSQLDLFRDFIVSDYDVFKSLIFSKITLPEDEFMLYRKLFYQVYKDIARPDLYVYLYQNTKRLQQNIKKRGRTYEKEIQDDYLESINKGYLEFLKSHPEFNIKIIDISDKDFILNREDYLWILDKISKS